ncbi:MAG: nitrile hydratase subunit beta [Gammaproteobacteria bacterium]|nr:nitrile hydratase subunit beta [Gammaproteobacteria bacterium]
MHDLGGREGFGAIDPEADEPAFHARWEAAVFAMVMAGGRTGATGNADRFRHAIERIDPVAYLTHGYYGRWLGGIETLLVEAGVVDRDELDRRARARGAAPDDRIAARPEAQPDAVPPATDPTTQRTLSNPPRFSPGDPVRTLAHGHSGHTRLPGYARGRRGTVVEQHGGWVFPDRNAHGEGEQPCHLYTVAFSARELWGEDADPEAEIHLDLFEPYLEPNP